MKSVRSLAQCKNRYDSFWVLQKNIKGHLMEKEKLKMNQHQSREKVKKRSMKNCDQEMRHKRLIKEWNLDKVKFEKNKKEEKSQLIWASDVGKYDIHGKIWMKRKEERSTSMREICKLTNSFCAKKPVGKSSLEEYSAHRNKAWTKQTRRK